MKNTKDYEKTLKWINKIRVQFGDPPLDEILTGTVSCAFRCPVANSIGHKCLVTKNRVTYFVDDDINEAPYHMSYRNPRYVRRFIEAVDTYKYPELLMDRDDIVFKSSLESRVSIVK